MPTLPTTNIARHFDASTNTGLYKNITGGVLADNPADGEAFTFWDDLVDTNTDSTRVTMFADGTTPNIVWRDDSTMPFPSVDMLDGVLRLRTQGGTGLAYAPPSPSSYTILLAFYIDSSGTYPNSSTTYFNCTVVGGVRNAYSGVYLRKNGSTYTLYPYNWDGDEDGSSIGINVTPDEPHTLCIRHDSGTLYFSVDCGTEFSEASGNTTNQTAFYLGDEGVNSGTTADFRGRFGELAIYQPGITGTDLANAKQYFCDKWLSGILNQMKGCFVAGADGTVTSTLTAMFNLDGTTRSVDAQGSLVVGGSIMLPEQSFAPTAISDAVRIWAEDNGSGKTRLMAQFGTGAAQQIAIEP